MAEQVVRMEKFQKQSESMIEATPIPALCIVGFSGSGKTGVTVDLIAALKKCGLRVGSIKHDVHGFEMDRPGKDSWRHKQAGALTTLISNPYQIGLVMDVDHDHQPNELLPFFSGMDIVLIEGFKQAKLPKIEVYRPENKKPPACKGDPHLFAVVSSASLHWGVPVYLFNGLKRLADQITVKFALDPCISPLADGALG